MTPHATDIANLARQLRDEGVNVGGEGALLFATYELDGFRRQTVLFINPEGWDYLVCVAPVQPLVLDELSAAELRTIFRLASGITLAKLEVAKAPDEKSEILVATSECSFDGITGKKLARRAEACARLAGLARAALSP